MQLVLMYVDALDTTILSLSLQQSENPHFITTTTIIIIIIIMMTIYPCLVLRFLLLLSIVCIFLLWYHSISYFLYLLFLHNLSYDVVEFNTLFKAHLKKTQKQRSFLLLP